MKFDEFKHHVRKTIDRVSSRLAPVSIRLRSLEPRRWVRTRLALVVIWLRNLETKRRLFWLGNLVFAIFIGTLAIPLAREFPEDFHRYVIESGAFIRWGVCFAVGLGVTWLLVRIFSAKVTQICSRIWLKFPPLWLAWCVAAIFLWGYDVVRGLGPKGGEMDFWEWLMAGFPTDSKKAAYQGTCLDWIVMALLPVGVILGGHWLFGKQPEEPVEVEATKKVSINELIKKWHIFKEWLESEDTAKFDFLDYDRIATRMADRMLERNGTFGLIGDYGSGKSSLIRWMKNEVRKKQKENPKLPQVWFVDQSCWGFEDSSTAIHQMLSAAVQELGKHVDCFSFRFLPESYRKTFSGGDDWVHSILDMLLGCTDPIDQFEHLEAILECANAQVVFIIEDLDRNDSNRFDRQDVLALLQTLRKFKKRFSFVLATGKERSSDIDFAKICEHIQLLPELTKEQLWKLINRLRQQCLEEHRVIAVENEKTHWFLDPDSSDSQPADFLTPISKLIRTPRTLKIGLRHTYRAWQHLYGEVSLDVLIAVNLIRYGVPDLFDFLLRYHSELLGKDVGFYDVSTAGNEMNTRLKLPWETLIQKLGMVSIDMVELLSYLIPNSARNVPLQRSLNCYTAQGIHQQKYWIRIVNESADDNDVKDQEFLLALSKWIRDPERNAEIYSRFYSKQQYCDLVASIAEWQFKNCPEKYMELIDFVVREYCDYVDQYYVPGSDTDFDLLSSRLFDGLRGLYDAGLIPEDKLMEFFSKQFQQVSQRQIYLINELLSCLQRVNGAETFLGFKRQIRGEVVALFKTKLTRSKDWFRLFSGSSRPC